MEAVGSVSVARTRFLKKMYEYKCVRQAGYVLEYAHLRDNLYQCTGCKRHKKMRSVTIVNDELVPGKLHPKDGHHIECASMPHAGTERLSSFYNWSFGNVSVHVVNLCADNFD